MLTETPLTCRRMVLWEYEHCEEV